MISSYKFSSSRLLPAFAVMLASAAAASDAQAAKYGCFIVTAEAINIRERPYSSSKVIGSAVKGDVLEKRKMFCTPRGFWCAVRKGKLEGYADKSNMVKLSVCP